MFLKDENICYKMVYHTLYLALKKIISKFHISTVIIPSKF